MKAAADWLTEVRALEGRGELVLAYDTALRGLGEHPDDIWLKYRAVLALAKSGATRRAGNEFRRLGLAGRTETDIAALDARIAKDEALALPESERAAGFARAADAYERIYRRGGGYYPGINVATLRLLAGEQSIADTVAREVLGQCATAGDGEAYYARATEAEALLILGRIEEARAALDTAARLSNDLAARATTRRQLRLICTAKGIGESLLAPLAPPTTIHYAGHRMAPPGASGKLTSADEQRVAGEIAALLDRHRVGFGYGALASGADILFAEALLARGAELHVVLPFDADEFIAVSVASSGGDWVRRFETCRKQASSITQATEDRYLGHDSLFNYGSQIAMGLAVLRARFIDGAVRQMAVWDGGPAGGESGTAVDVALWQGLGRATDIVACGSSGPTAAEAQQSSVVPRQRVLKAMLFGDVKGFSGLNDQQLPLFVEHILGAWSKVLAGHGDAVLSANTWGDALYTVFADPAVAARCALQLQEAVERLDLPALGLPDDLLMRLGCHFGPVYAIYDPVQARHSFGGAHVSRTARIEPVTPPGEVYLTEAFAASLALSPESFACDYVGEVPAAKGYGVLRMYHLHAARASQ